MAVIDREVMTPEQVADYLQVRPQTVWEWLRSGRMPGIKLGRLWRVRRADLEGFLTLRQIEASADLNRKELRDYMDDEIADMLENDRLATEPERKAA